MVLTKDGNDVGGILGLALSYAEPLSLFGKAAVLPANQRPLQHRVDSVELNLSRMAKETPARASIKAAPCGS